MLAKRNIQTDDRLTNALEGLARWADEPAAEPKASAAAPAPEPEPAPELAPAPEPRPGSPAPRLQPAASLRAALAEIAARQNDLDRDAPPAPRRPTAAPEVDPSLIVAMRREIDALGRAIEGLPTRADVDSLLAEIGSLAARWSDDRPARLDTDSLAAVQALVQEVERVRGDAASPRTLALFADELSALSSKLDALGPSGAEAFEALAERVADLKAELGQCPRLSAVEALAQDIKGLVGRIDAQERAAGERERKSDQVEERLQVELARLSSRPALDGVQERIDALADRFESWTEDAISAIQSAPSNVDVLSGKLDAISAATLSRSSDIEKVADAVRSELAAIAQPAALQNISETIERLTREIASRAEAAPNVSELSVQVAGLSERMAAAADQARSREDAIDRIESAVHGIAEHLVATATNASPAGAAPEALSAMQDRIGSLVDSLDRTDGRIDDLNAGFAALAARLEQGWSTLGRDVAKAAAAAVHEGFADQGAPAAIGSGELAEALSEIRAAATRNDRRTAETLDAVRMTLERMVERMENFGPRTPVERAFERSRSEDGPAGDDRPMTAPAPVVDATEAARAAARRAMAEIEPDKATAKASNRDVLPDLPLEPGFGAWPRNEAAAPNAASFIAAARRATVQTPVEDEAEPEERDSPAGRLSSFFGGLKARRRPLLLALAAALIVLGVVRFASGVDDRHEEGAAEPTAQAESAVVPQAKSSDAAPAAVEAPPVITAPAAAPEQPSPEAAPPAEPPKPGAALAPPRAAAQDLTDFAFGPAIGKPAQGFASLEAGELVTGSVNRESDALPDAIGGATLRMRAVQGDPSAQLEIGDRFAEGRGVPADPAAAARWLEKAAAQGLAPAQHRLGSLYEKGRGVARDLVVARRWYEQAAASGNVRAMHNLGVIHAEGGLGKPDFGAAVVWFRMAAERGLIDSQYNLAVLQARGMTGKRDLAEAYKWFALAAAQGDEDASRKRDEVGKALGAGLVAAKQSVETFRPRMVDGSANEIPTPPGGWDRVSAAPKGGAPISLR